MAEDPTLISPPSLPACPPACQPATLFLSLPPSLLHCLPRRRVELPMCARTCELAFCECGYVEGKKYIYKKNIFVDRTFNQTTNSQLSGLGTGVTHTSKAIHIGVLRSTASFVSSRLSPSLRRPGSPIARIMCTFFSEKTKIASVYLCTCTSTFHSTSLSVSTLTVSFSLLAYYSRAFFFHANHESRSVISVAGKRWP